MQRPSGDTRGAGAQAGISSAVCKLTGELLILTIAYVLNLVKPVESGGLHVRKQLLSHGKGFHLYLPQWGVGNWGAWEIGGHGKLGGMRN